MTEKTSRKCSLWWCEKPYYANGFCKAHDIANKRFGTPYGKHAPQFKRIMDLLATSSYMAHAILEFANAKQATEFVPVTTSNITNPYPNIPPDPQENICQICHQPLSAHDDFCVTRVAETILRTLNS